MNLEIGSVVVVELPLTPLTGYGSGMIRFRANGHKQNDWNSFWDWLLGLLGYAEDTRTSSKPTTSQR